MKIRGIEVKEIAPKVQRYAIHCPYCGEEHRADSPSMLRKYVDNHLGQCHCNPQNEGCGSCKNFSEGGKYISDSCKFIKWISVKLWKHYNKYHLHCPCYNMSIDDYVKRVNDWAKTQDGITEQKGYSGAEAGALTEYDELDGAAGQAMGTSE